MKTKGIYLIRNTTSGRCYVGSSQNIEGRFKAHRHMLNNGTHHSPSLQRSWNKHGSAAFVFQIIEIVDDIDDLLAVEQRHIDFLHAADTRRGFNVSPIAGTRRGVPQPQSVIDTLREFHSGKPKTAEHRAKIGRGNKGKVRSDETKQKLRKITQQQFADPRAREIAAENARLQWTDPKIRARTATAIQIAMDRPDVKATISRKALERAGTDEGKANLAKATEAARLANTGRKMGLSPLKGKPRPDKRTPSTDLIQRMKYLRADGLSYAKIAKEVGRDVATVWKYCNTASAESLTTQGEPK